MIAARLPACCPPCLHTDPPSSHTLLTHLPSCPPASTTPPPTQAEYHAEKVRAFPHVNSPARLIRALVRPAAQAAQAPAAPGSAKAAAQAQAAAADAGGKENAGMEVEA